MKPGASVSHSVQCSPPLPPSALVPTTNSSRTWREKTPSGSVRHLGCPYHYCSCLIAQIIESGWLIINIINWWLWELHIIAKLVIFQEYYGDLCN